MNPRAVAAIVGLGCLTWSASAMAEVIDKVIVPWAPERLVATLLITGMCSLLMVLAARIQGHFRWGLVLGAVGLALLWLMLGTADDFFSTDVGPAIRAELPAADVAVYALLAPIEALAPAVATLAIRLANIA